MNLVRLFHTYPFFFFNDTATTEIYTLSLHDALPISTTTSSAIAMMARRTPSATVPTNSITKRRRARRASSPEASTRGAAPSRSEEHTSELQSRLHLVCRLLLEKKKDRT